MTYNAFGGTLNPTLHGQVFSIGTVAAYSAEYGALVAYRVVVVVVVVVEYLYSASRSASNALIVPQRCEEMCL